MRSAAAAASRRPSRRTTPAASRARDESDGVTVMSRERVGRRTTGAGKFWILGGGGYHDSMGSLGLRKGCEGGLFCLRRLEKTNCVVLFLIF